jgi:pimeloyl-ACP methyl ester carboxylesterase
MIFIEAGSSPDQAQLTTGLRPAQHRQLLKRNLRSQLKSKHATETTMTSTGSAASLQTPRYIQANGLEFAYLEAGSGPLVFVLHGFPDTAWSFAPLVQRIADAGFHAVAPFLRGYPPSGFPDDRDYSVAALGRDVIALAEHFGEQKVQVVGHDWGAATAYAAAALRPDRIAGIVAAGLPHLRRFLLRPSRAQLRASHYIFKFQLPGWAERRIPKDDFVWLQELVQSWSPGWEIQQEGYFNPVKAAFAQPEHLQAALSYYRAIPRILFQREAWQFLLQPLQVPARVIFGEADGCILPQSFSGMEHLFGEEFDLIGLPCGHFLHLESADAFASLVIEFIKRQ